MYTVQNRYISEWTCKEQIYYRMDMSEYIYYTMDMYRIDILHNGYVQNRYIIEGKCTEQIYYRMDVYKKDVLQSRHVQNNILQNTFSAN